MVLLPVQVNPTNRETTLAHSVSLEELTKLESVRYPVQVVFYDEQRQLYMDVLEWLMHQNGSRTEVITANYRASAAYAKLLPKESRWEVSYDKRLDETKGMRILPNAQPDAATTAKMLLAAPELVDHYYAEEFLGKTLSDSPKASESSVMTYVALAAMDQPVLLEIKSYLSDCDQLLTDSQKLWLGCALAKLGDFEGAQPGLPLGRGTLYRKGRQAVPSGRPGSNRRCDGSALAVSEPAGRSRWQRTSWRQPNKRRCRRRCCRIWNC